MDDVKKELASDAPPSRPCRPASPGLFFIDFWKGEFIISQELIEYNGPDLRNGEIVWVVRWKKH